MKERVKRLQKRTAHAEFPHSRTQRLIGNVRVVSDDGDEIHVRSTFATFRSRYGKVDIYYGRHEHILVAEGGTLKIKQKSSFQIGGSSGRERVWKYVKISVGA